MYVYVCVCVYIYIYILSSPAGISRWPSVDRLHVSCNKRNP